MYHVMCYIAAPVADTFQLMSLKCTPMYQALLFFWNELYLEIVNQFQQRAYRMSSRPRGHCIILNIMNYNDQPDVQREGSEVDVERLQRLFEQLGYQLEVWEDLTKPVSDFCMNPLWSISEI